MQINVLDYLEKTAAKYPGKTAIIDEQNRIKFSELKMLAKAAGSALIAEKPAAIRSPVAVLVNRTAAAIISFLGVLYSGNYYAPIDARVPKQRLQLLLDDLKPSFVICEKKDLELLESLDNSPPCLVYEDIIHSQVNDRALAEIRKRIIDLDPVYILYTSGSTGIPKGTVVPQRSVIDLTEWLASTFDFASDEVMGNQTPFYFDASVKDIYLCLKTGMTMVIIPQKLFMFPLLLLDYLNEHRVTTILWATSTFVLLANSKVFAQKKPLYLKKIFFAGEAMYGKYLNIWRKYFPQAMYVNLYGPTEVTVDCTYYIVDREFADDEPVPIGRACRNMEVFLLDENNRLITASGKAGEICVRGTGVALGYYRDPKRTAEVFVQNPLNSDYRDLVYRTGDIARLNEYGELVFCGRKDEQVKHQGNRIELGEIERAACSQEGVEACVCFYDEKNKRIVLQYVGHTGEVPLLRGLRERLPRYMLPAVIERRQEFPYNANGKIDRRKIMEIYYGKNN